MHNCKATRRRLAEIALNGTALKPDEHLANELRGCLECSEEFASVSQTLRLTSRFLQSAAPRSEFWPRYYERLRGRLKSESVHPIPTVNTKKFELRKLFTAAVPVPVPVLMLLVLMFGVMLLMVGRQNASPTTTTTTVVRVPVEVPVVQEKVVAKVVYRDRFRRKSNRQNDSAVALKEEPHDANSVSLIGFKPLDEVRLTVIKGGDQDEK